MSESDIPEPVEETPVIDLMEALRKSVDEAQKQKKPAASKPKAKSSSGGTRKRAAASGRRK